MCTLKNGTDAIQRGMEARRMRCGCKHTLVLNPFPVSLHSPNRQAICLPFGLCKGLCSRLHIGGTTSSGLWLHEMGSPECVVSWCSMGTVTVELFCLENDRRKRTEPSCFMVPVIVLDQSNSSHLQASNIFGCLAKTLHEYTRHGW